MYNISRIGSVIVLKSVVKVIGLVVLAGLVGFGTYKITDKLDPKVSPCNCDCNNNNVTDSVDIL